MNGIPALLISKEFCVEIVIVKHTSCLASFPDFSVFTKCITLGSISLHLLTLCVPCFCSSFYVPQVTCMEKL